MNIRDNDGEAFENFRIDLEKRLREIRLIDDPQLLQSKVKEINHELEVIQVQKINAKMRELKKKALFEADVEMEVRVAAARSIGNLGSEDGISVLAVALKTDYQLMNVEVKKEVIMALAKIGGDKIIQSLTEVLQTEQNEIKISALNALSTLNFDQVRTILTNAISDNEKEVRLETIKILTNYDIQEAFPLLKVSLNVSSIAVANPPINCSTSCMFLKFIKPP